MKLVAVGLILASLVAVSKSADPRSTYALTFQNYSTFLVCVEVSYLNERMVRQNFEPKCINPGGSVDFNIPCRGMDVDIDVSAGYKILNEGNDGCAPIKVAPSSTLDLVESIRQPILFADSLLRIGNNEHGAPVVLNIVQSDSPLQLELFGQFGINLFPGPGQLFSLETPFN